MRSFGSIDVLATTVFDASSWNPQESIISTICLVMAVKNNAATIERCVHSIRGRIDCWLIADTGSTDSTVGLLGSALADIPGEILSLPARTVSEAREQLLASAVGRADYLLWLEPDETIEFTACHSLSDLNLEAYFIDVASPPGAFPQLRLAMDGSSYGLPGRISNTSDELRQFPRLDRLLIRKNQSDELLGAQIDASLDIAHIVNAPSDTPDGYQQLLDVAAKHVLHGRWPLALKLYNTVRTEETGDRAARWYAEYQAACLLDKLDFSKELVIEAYLTAHESWPEKIEPLIRIARHCRIAGELDTALEIIGLAQEQATPNLIYYYEPDAWLIYRDLEQLRIHLALGERDQAISTADHMLNGGHLTDSERSLTEILRLQASDMGMARAALGLPRAPEDNTAVPSTAPDSAAAPDATMAAIPEATPSGAKRKLCIGMATFDDYDGVYFSVQALRMYHPEILDEIEILVIDNNPKGAAAKYLKDLDLLIPNYRYVPESQVVGTTIRDRIFHEANADYVLVMDCHVFIEPGALRRLLDYFEQHPKTLDLLQGPLLHDDLKTVSTHFKTGWGGGMWGSWDTDERGLDTASPPFEIPMQGLGLFACRKAAWPGFNPNFRGFGGEEGYIHEKIRQSGGRALCLPFMRWMHRFNRPLGVPYPASWEKRIRNYIIGWTELGLDTESIREHFGTIIGQAETDLVFSEVAREPSEI